MSFEGLSTFDPPLVLSFDLSTVPETCFGVGQLAIDPVRSETLYVVAAPGFASGCFGGCSAVTSSDGGNSWSCMSLPFNLERLFAAPGTLYAFGGFTSPHGRGLGGLFRSTDAGATWTRIDAGLHTSGGRAAAFLALAIDPADASRVFVSEAQGVFRTTDGGRTWTEADGRWPIRGTVSPPAATNLALDPHNPAIVYASGDWGVYRTSNSGQTWYPIVGGLPPFAFLSSPFPTEVDVGFLLVDPVQDGKIYGGTLATGIYTYTVR